MYHVCKLFEWTTLWTGSMDPFVMDLVYGHFFKKESNGEININIRPTEIARGFEGVDLWYLLLLYVHKVFGYICLQPGRMTLMMVRSWLSFADINFLFAAFFFPYTVKLTFVLDDGPLHFPSYPRFKLSNRKKFPRAWQWINTQNK